MLQESTLAFFWKGPEYSQFTQAPRIKLGRKLMTNLKEVFASCNRTIGENENHRINEKSQNLT
jgi:hypothetical protein